MTKEMEEPKEHYEILGPQTVEVLEIGLGNMIIPECCREGWESCPHVAKKPKPAKKNIGL